MLELLELLLESSGSRFLYQENPLPNIQREQISLQSVCQPSHSRNTPTGEGRNPGNPRVGWAWGPRAGLCLLPLPSSPKTASSSPCSSMGSRQALGLATPEVCSPCLDPEFCQLLDPHRASRPSVLPAQPSHLSILLPIISFPHLVHLMNH